MCLTTAAVFVPSCTKILMKRFPVLNLSDNHLMMWLLFKYINKYYCAFQILQYLESWVTLLSSNPVPSLKKSAASHGNTALTLLSSGMEQTQKNIAILRVTCLSDISGCFVRYQNGNNICVCLQRGACSMFPLEP